VKRLLQALKHKWKTTTTVAGLLLAVSVIVWLPEAMVNKSYHGDQKHSIESGNNYAKLVDDYRKTVVQIIGGAFLLYTLYLTLRRTKATEETLRVSQRTLEVTRETQITDRFTKAIGQLGAIDSQGKKQIETRLGAIYALERIAKDSEPDHWPIMEILTAYVRHNSGWSNPENPVPQTNMPTVGDISEQSKQNHFYRLPDKDIQAILTVIGRRLHTRDKGKLDLTETVLMGADLSEAHLKGVDLRDAHLEGARLRAAHLEDGYLIMTHLEEADLSDAYLNGADLRGAHLEGARLNKAYLEGAYLIAAHLEGANFYEAHLEGAHLSQAHLEGAYLQAVHLEGADLRKAYLEGADLSEAHLEGADLSETHLELEALDKTYGDQLTRLPSHLRYSNLWPKPPDQSPSDTSEPVQHQ
jgi:uncharacterized protein YjbI with pentapeptide repeats